MSAVKMDPSSYPAARRDESVVDDFQSTKVLEAMQDVCACSAAEGQRRLAACGGVLELAIQEFLSEQDGRRPLLDEAAQNELNRQTELRRRNPQASSSSVDEGPSVAALGTSVASQPLGWIRWTVSLLLLPFHFAYSTFYDTCRFIYGLLFGTQGGQRAVENAEADVRSFWEEFERRPPRRSGYFLFGGARARREGAEVPALLVYLHSRTHPESERFCREVIAHPEFIQFVGRNAVFWACAVHTREGCRVSAALRETRYPALGLVCMREGRMALVMRLQGCHPVGDVLGALALALNDNDAHMVAARLEREQEEAYEAAQTEERRREERRRDDEQLERRRLNQRRVSDAYRWLEDPDNEETQAFVTKLNNISEPFMSAFEGRELMRKRLTELWNHSRFTCPMRNGNRYCMYFNSGLQEHDILCAHDQLDEKGRVFVDPNTLSDDGTTAVRQTKFSVDGSILAYGMSEKGSDWVTLKFLQVPSKELLHDTLLQLRHTTLAWMPDGCGIFYSSYPQHEGVAEGRSTTKNEYHSLFLHRLGTPQSSDLLIADFPQNPEFMVEGSVTQNWQQLVVSVKRGCRNMLYTLDITEPDALTAAKPKLFPLFDKMDASDEPWEEVIPEGTSKLDWVSAVAKDKLVLCYMEDVKHAIYIHDRKSGARLQQLYLPPFSQVTGFSGRKASSEGLRKDGENVTILNGFGGFNVPDLPCFSLKRVMFMQHFNGVYALANLRGGSEYGEKWHEAGMKERKQNAFDDFNAAAEFLARQGYTRADKLCAHGGLLAAVCANQRPELFGAVIVRAGVLDMLRYHKFTGGEAWVPEFGNPDLPADFEYIFKYSLLHNVRVLPATAPQLPAMLLMTADHDDTVVPLHTLKYAAELYERARRCAAQTNPLLVRVEVKAGHGAGKPTSKIIDEIVDMYSFVARIFGLRWMG